MEASLKGSLRRVLGGYELLSIVSVVGGAAHRMRGRALLRPARELALAPGPCSCCRRCCSALPPLEQPPQGPVLSGSRAPLQGLGFVIGSGVFLLTGQAAQLAG